MNATDKDLREFLKNIGTGAAPLESRRLGRAEAIVNTLSCAPPQADALMRLADRPPSGLTLYKFGSRSVVGSYSLVDGTKVVMKYYLPKNLHKHLSHGIAGSRCMRSWTAALTFQYLGLPTPAPLLVAEWHRLGGAWLTKSFLTTRHAEGVDLSTWVNRHASDTQRLTKMAAQLREVFGQMAEYRISHGDLKATNILVDEANANAISFIDLDATEILTPAARWRVTRNKDRARFAKNWANHPVAAQAFADVFEV